jgi:hypothetical protein
MRKKLTVGDYQVVVKYDEETNALDVEVLDELGDVIESINIQDDNDEEEESDTLNFNLN